jgi:hypothetical protein
MYSYSKMDTDTESKPKSTYNREKYEQNKEKLYQNLAYLVW